MCTKTAILIPARGRPNCASGRRARLSPPAPRNRPRHFAAAAHRWAAGKGHNNKESSHDHPQATAGSRSRRNARLPGSAAARHRGLPAHDRAAVRRPREVDQGAGRGDAERYVHPARDAEERVRRRSGDRRDLRDRHARERAAAAQAARRHREGAGRGRRARQDPAVQRDAPISTRRARVVLADEMGDKRRGGGARALGRHRVRRLCEAQQEGLAGSRRRGPADRGLRQARRHGRLAPRGEDSRQAGGARDDDRRRAAREGARPDGERDLRAAGREAHPHARQAPDGEDAARVLPQRTDEGDPEGAGRRGRPRRTRRTRREDQEDQALEGSAREGDARAQEAAADVADVGGSDRRAQLSRLAALDPVEQEVEGQEGSAARAGASSTTTTTGSRRSRSASSSISRCRAAPTS